MNLQSNWFVRSRLKTRQIVLLLYLYEQRSVLRAAQLAGMTQPAASKMLGELEETLGVQLFERHARGIRATCYGEILARHARSALTEIGRANEEILALKSGVSGQASIGTVLNPGMQLVPLAIATVKRAYPRLLVSVEMDSSGPLVSRLREGLLDCVIGRILESEGADELNFEPWFDEPHRLVARAGHPLAQRRGLTLADLMDQGWILQGAGGVQRGRFDAMLCEHGLGQPENIVETCELPVAIELLQLTDMVTVQPEQAVLPYCKAGLLTFLPVTIDMKMDFFGLITRREHALSPSSEVVIRVLRETATKVYRPKLHAARDELLPRQAVG